MLHDGGVDLSTVAVAVRSSSNRAWDLKMTTARKVTRSLQRTGWTVRRLLALVAVAALCLGLASMPPASAQAAGKNKPGKAATPAAAPEAPAACTLTHPDRPKDEWAMCTVADVELQSTPAIGKTTKAILTVKSQVAVDDAQIMLSVNENFSVTDGDGFGDARTRASGVGPVSTISRSADLAAGGSKTYEFTVRAVSKGYGVVQARVKTGDARTAAGDEDAVQLGGGSALSPTGGLAVTKAPANAPQARATTPARYRAATVDDAGALSAQAPGASCATGRWVFNNELGQQTSSMNFQVQVWDQDPGGTDDHLATGVTNGTGNYNICFESTDSDGGGGQEVYVKFISEVAQWRVRNTAASNSNYVFTTGVIAIPDPGTANFGGLQPSDPALHRALHAYRRHQPAVAVALRGLELPRQPRPDTEDDRQLDPHVDGRDVLLAR